MIINYKLDITEQRRLTLVLINSVGELVESGRNLQSLEENSLLTLNSNVFGPLHKPSQVSLWLDAGTNPEATGVLAEQRTLHFATGFSAC